MKITSHRYEWDDEPVDERPSEFLSSMNLIAQSRFASMPEAAPRARRVIGPPSSASDRGFGFGRAVMFCLGLMAVGGCVLGLLPALLRG